MHICQIKLRVEIVTANSGKFCESKNNIRTNKPFLRPRQRSLAVKNKGKRKINFQSGIHISCNFWETQNIDIREKIDPDILRHAFQPFSNTISKSSCKIGLL